jgi:ABC-type multidrug transport system ATPase subunit
VTVGVVGGVRLESVTKRWGDNVVLRDVDLEIGPGRVTGIAGDNGAGKTTLLRVASGMVAPEDGRVLFGGVEIERRRASYQRAIGLLSAGDRGLYARLTVRQNLSFCGGIAGLSRGERVRRIAEVLSEFALEELEHQRVERLSMGQRQRVRLAATFLHEPVIVFLDEPRTSLDETGVSLLARALDRLAGRGGAALWVSLERDEPLVTHPWWLAAGRLQHLERAGAGSGAVVPPVAAS